ncbi:anaphase-promoting complex subunit cdc27 [Entomophthora muscae]|uniref:Anaphase-promoting complex subunit cdc27 n=1 Tax=Entomophthora muscae TaxID=34485 RepID=A0ACC2SW65_9FUNG|nr:anaphase-promoting complex subunit cdc27 [Entomophthora muscae]
MKKLNVMFMEFSLCQASMAKIDPAEALESLSRLPYCQSKSPWVQCAKGRMHLEATNFKEAKEAYTEARNEAPYLTSSMGYFSTVLWQLRDEHGLTLLANDLQDLEPLGYDTMIVLGNAYSLQSWPELSIQAFQEASKVDPLRSYAYTLAGHEGWGSNKGDFAAKMFRLALQVCPRDYSAIFGLGNILPASNEYHDAIFYFNKALEIHPNSALLKEKLAAAYLKQGDFEAGLICYNEAIQLAPSKNPLKFQKARVLIALGEFKEALRTLLPLKRRHMEDPALHFTLGKLYFLMGNSLDAYIHLRWACDLMPDLSGKVEHIIKLYEKGDLKDLSPDACRKVVFDSSQITLSKL